MQQKKYKQEKDFRLKLEGNEFGKSSRIQRMKEEKRNEMDIDRKLKANRRRNGKPQQRSWAFPKTNTKCQWLKLGIKRSWNFKKKMIRKEKYLISYKKEKSS